MKLLIRGTCWLQSWTTAGGLCSQLSTSRHFDVSSAGEQSVYRVSEVSVDGAVEEEIERELIAWRRLKMATVTLYRSVVSRVAMLPKKFSISAGNEQDHVHDDDDDQRQGYPIGDVIVPAGCAGLRSHLGRSAQGVAQVGVAEDQDCERDEDPEEEIDPLVDRLHDWVRFEQDRIREIKDSSVRTLERRNRFLQKSGNVEERAGDKDNGEGHDRECLPYELSGLEGVTDCHESTGCHGDGEPGACQDERVDDRLAVDTVEQPEVVVIVRETSVFQKRVR